MTKSAYRGNGYWAVQIGASALMGFGGLVGGFWWLLASEEDKGFGLILMLTGVAFIAAFVWCIRNVTGHSKLQRAIYAWTIMQQQGGARSVPGDFAAMGVAARARDGKLTRADILALQALRPEVAYPGVLPEN